MDRVGMRGRRKGRESRRRDRPEFVQLGEPVSSGFTSQNGQTQTEERNMDVRGCTKGNKGRGTKSGQGQCVLVWEWDRFKGLQ